MIVKVFVVMGNDYPDAVFKTEQAAEDYCEARKAEYKPDAGHMRIYWRTYEFLVRDQ